MGPIEKKWRGTNNPSGMAKPQNTAEWQLPDFFSAVPLNPAGLNALQKKVGGEMADR